MPKKFPFKKSRPIAIEIGQSHEKIVFGFSELRAYSYIDSHNDSNFYISFLDRLRKLSSIDWETANMSHRHSFGMEKMDIANITKAAKTHVPIGMESLLVFRATGDNHVFLGYREGNVFQVIFIEYQFGDVYNHAH